MLGRLIDRAQSNWVVAKSSDRRLPFRYLQRLRRPKGHSRTRVVAASFLLYEVPQFATSVLDALRQLLEPGEVARIH